MPTSAPQAAKPTKTTFDPFNSSATGHQRADNRLSSSTSWRDSRTSKLRNQFASGKGGGKRVHDSVGAGSLDFGTDGRTENGGWVKGAKGLRRNGQASLQEVWHLSKTDDQSDEPARKKVKTEKNTPSAIVNPFTPFRKNDGTVRETSWPDHYTQVSQGSSPGDLLSSISSAASVQPSPATETVPAIEESEPPIVRTGTASTSDKLPKQLFANCCIYLNGSTAPLISDHKLKHVLSTHGANMSISLGRRTVTHVILGTTFVNGGCGGGLAGSKIQKEIESVRSKGVRFVTVEWVLESIKAGKRLPEGRFPALKLAAKRQGSVATMFAKTAPTSDADT